MTKLKKLLVLLFSFMALFAVILSIPSKAETVHADTGPKPDMQITIKNLEKSDYAIAFAVQQDGWGPHFSYNPDHGTHHDYSYENEESLKKIYFNVSLPEGWNLLEICKVYKDTSEFVIKSGYMWPSDFILIIYNEVNAKYYLTEETKTYAFHSYFEFDMNDYKNEDIVLAKPIVLEKNYQWGKETLGFFVRLLTTLAIELGLALLFRFTKKSFLIIAVTNAATQIGLNVGLTLTAHFHGTTPWLVPMYAMLEAAIVVVEAIIFKKFCKRGTNESNQLVITYTILANILSFGLGMLLWFVL